MPGVELTTGGWIASAVIGKVADLGRSYLSDNYDLHTGTKVMLEKLVFQLSNIQSVIEKAEKRKLTDKGLVNSLEQLKDAAYVAEDVFDDFEGQRIRESIKGKGKVSEIASSSVKIVKTLIFSDKDLKKLKSVVKKLDELGMGDFVKTAQLINSVENNEYMDNSGRETSSKLAPDVVIFGRDKEIELILDMIFNVLYGDFYRHQALDDPQSQHGNGEGSSSFWVWDRVKSFLGWTKPGKPMDIQTIEKGDAPEQSRNRLTTIKSFLAEPHSIYRKLAVIPIVGVGGVGKTVVAKTIYNDERVKEHFALRAWVYVSENCDTKKIMQDILHSLAGGITDPSMNLENVGNKLQETITNHRILLVIDDFRDLTKLEWSELVSVLVYGEVGSVVIVTTQSRTIANTIRTLPEITLDVLQPESFWELFQYYAFGGSKLGELNMLLSKQQEVYNLNLIGKKIAKKLHGLPLAGKVIGTLLSNRLEIEFWKDILGSDWWNIEGARENILPSIGVGYNYLDPELKQCFLFCSIFPKQYVFERERLIQMWIAQGFIQPCKEETGRLDKGEIRLEDIGREWFSKLVDRSLFQPTFTDGKYLMHDLVRELAIALSSSEFCFVKLKSDDQHFPSLARHLGIDCDSLKVECKCKERTRVRTVILFGNWVNCSDKSISNIFAKYNGLRVLDISYIELEKTTPVDVACQLSHLRFVDLSFTGIKLIPEKFCSLFHLQVLDVRGCEFKKLPEGMNQLVNLRHLYASCDTISQISCIGKLTKLQELEEFRIEKHKGHRISELMDMNEISGHLLLSNLNNVSSKDEATKSQLEKKKYLKSLELRFEYDGRGPRTEVNMEVLDALKLAGSIEILKVGGCMWESFPHWMFSRHRDFCNLKVIHVYCFWLSSLPSFGELHFLEILTFNDLPLIEKVGSEFYGRSDVAFPSLKELSFSRMSSWRDWLDVEDGKMKFPQLKKLHLEKCSLLDILPLDIFASSVVELILSKCPCLYNIETVLAWMPSLAHMSITQVQSSRLSIDCTPLNSLEVMHLADIEELCFVGGLKSLVNLRKLVIINFVILNSYEVIQEENDEISQEIDKQRLQFLTYLHLSYKKSLRFYPLTSQRLPRVLGRLSSLRTLLIEYLPTDIYTSDEESWFNQLASMEKLEFRNCSWLRRLPSQLHLLPSLKKLRIHDCPMMSSLPENGLPQNLAALYIDKCRNLIRQCQPNHGIEWHKISHIPFLYFDGELVSGNNISTGAGGSDN